MQICLRQEFRSELLAKTNIGDQIEFIIAVRITKLWFLLLEYYIVQMETEKGMEQNIQKVLEFWLRLYGLKYRVRKTLNSQMRGKENSFYETSISSTFFCAAYII